MSFSEWIQEGSKLESYISPLRELSVMIAHSKEGGIFRLMEELRESGLSFSSEVDDGLGVSKLEYSRGQ